MYCSKHVDIKVGCKLFEKKNQLAGLSFLTSFPVVSDKLIMCGALLYRVVSVLNKQSVFVFVLGLLR